MEPLGYALIDIIHYYQTHHTTGWITLDAIAFIVTLSHAYKGLSNQYIRK